MLWGEHGAPKVLKYFTFGPSIFKIFIIVMHLAPPKIQYLPSNLVVFMMAPHLKFSSSTPDSTPQSSSSHTIRLPGKMMKTKRMERMKLGIKITTQKYKVHLLQKVDSQVSVFHILLLHHIHLSHTAYQKKVKMRKVCSCA